MVAARVASSVVRRQVRYVAPVPAGVARGLVAEVYAQAQDEQKLVVPPVLLHSPAPPVLAAYWMLMREPLLAGRAVDRRTKEAVAAGVSVANTCPYCVDMHSISLYDLATEDDAEAVADDRLADLGDPVVRSVASWARQAHTGTTPAPFPAAHGPELVGVVVAFHYLARVVNVFLPDHLLPAGLSGAARRRFKRAVGRLLRPTLRAAPRPGRSLALLPAAALPVDAGWAAADPVIAEATARAYRAFDRAGEEAVPPSVRTLVRGRLDRWDGEPPGPGRRWCDEAVEELPEPDRAAGRLVLLTAFASHLVDERVVAGFRRAAPTDRALVQAVAWAAYAAAREVGRRCPGPAIR
ncbi:alkylhydroperoxidase AhpD family core domain-containing protein [Micromonospora matsumotoense]|uniref:Alkylhydroperoxidase AhpD family core domain-containing protein n=1 Tax=Micromonospora matsumotoense TaxID=121616 RepID=A0A1C4X125_9ACTN|nr:carboxymuconolactone decarboxylase family protein [Micromonospora matsumotoense]SCF02163.1 alkylhydroperoxidase AhpD family core domain-containing protein [Micromonospora matsumotoense]